MSFAQERLVRARYRARLAQKQVEAFRREYNVRDERGVTATALARLERLLFEAQADEMHAQGLFDAAQEDFG